MRLRSGRLWHCLGSSEHIREIFATLCPVTHFLMSEDDIVTYGNKGFHDQFDDVPHDMLLRPYRITWNALCTIFNVGSWQPKELAIEKTHSPLQRPRVRPLDISPHVKRSKLPLLKKSRSIYTSNHSLIYGFSLMKRIEWNCLIRTRRPE